MATRKKPHPTKPRNDISAEYARQLLSYNKKTGKMRWKVNIYRVIKKGALAGCQTKAGPWIITINGRIYKLHRLAWLIVTGRWPLRVDHKNNDSGNNRWKNLREATPAQNRRNSRKYRTNTSGYTGVTKHRDKWRVFILKKHVGIFLTKEEAAKAYQLAAQKLYGVFTNKHIIHRSISECPVC